VEAQGKSDAAALVVVEDVAATGDEEQNQVDVADTGNEEHIDLEWPCLNDMDVRVKLHKYTPGLVNRRSRLDGDVLEFHDPHNIMAVLCEMPSPAHTPSPTGRSSSQVQNRRLLEAIILLLDFCNSFIEWQNQQESFGGLLNALFHAVDGLGRRVRVILGGEDVWFVRIECGTEVGLAKMPRKVL
jgi:hypothetical protein